MGLLDSDAEELKSSGKSTSSPTSTGSGRKVNQSGLGAFKSKYSNLTAKYRKPTETTDLQTQVKTAEYPTVEQGRGTISNNPSIPPPFHETNLNFENEVSAKSGQSPGKASANNVIEQANNLAIEVSAKSGQSQCKVSADNDNAFNETADFSDIQASAKSVQSPGDVSAKISTQIESTFNTGESTQKEVSAKSGQSPGKASAKHIIENLSSSKDAIEIKQVVNAKNEVSAESVQSQCNPNASIESNPLDIDNAFITKVSAKSVHSQCDNNDNNLNSADLIITSDDVVGAKSVQSQCEVSAEINNDSKANSENTITKPSAKSVQSPGNVSANQNAAQQVNPKTELSAKPVQCPVEVSAVIKSGSYKNINLHKTELKEKSGQTPNDINARTSESAAIPFQRLSNELVESNPSASTTPSTARVDEDSVRSNSGQRANHFDHQQVSAKSVRNNSPSQISDTVDRVSVKASSSKVISETDANLLEEINWDVTSSSQHSLVETPASDLFKSKTSHAVKNTKTEELSVKSFRSTPSDRVEPNSNELLTHSADTLMAKPSATSIDENLGTIGINSNEAVTRNQSTPLNQKDNSRTDLHSNNLDCLRAISEVSARPAQSQGDVSANSVQSPSIVGASLHSSFDFKNLSQGEVRSEVRAQVGAKLVRTQGKLEPLESVSALAGAQLNVIKFLFERCIWNHGVVTPPITKQQLMEGSQLTEETALSAIKRLRKKLIIDRYSYKDGKAGWTQYILAEETYRELLQLRQYSANSVQSPSIVSSKVGSIVSAEVPNSSSSLRKEEIKETTNTNNFDSLPAEWRAIDLTLISETHCRMSRADLVDIHRAGMLSAQELQDSIVHLHHELTKLKKHVDRNVFYGVVKKKGAPWFSQDYVQSVEKAISDQVAAATRVKNARVEQARAEEDLEFQTWLANLSPEEKLDMVKEMPIKNTNGKLFESFAFSYFQRKQDLSLNQSDIDSADIGRQIDESLAGQWSDDTRAE